MAAEVASLLDSPLDVLVVRKVGLPGQPELAMGAVAEGEVVIRNAEVLRIASVSDEEFEKGVQSSRVELAARVADFRGSAPPVEISGHTAVIVDDGLATGSTARAAIEVCRHRGAAQVWVAVPVSPRDIRPDFERLSDCFITLHEPRWFHAVGAWYDDFTQTSTAEVRSILDRR